jgi:hypothetical protein
MGNHTSGGLGLLSNGGQFQRMAEWRRLLQLPTTVGVPHASGDPSRPRCHSAVSVTSMHQLGRNSLTTGAPCSGDGLLTTAGAPHSDEPGGADRQVTAVPTGLMYESA